jgi:hypothetical protein
MSTIKYVNPLWDRRERYGFPISKYQIYTGTIVDEQFDHIKLNSGTFVHHLRKSDIVSIDDQDVEYKIPGNVKKIVEGSKGNQYTVERINGMISCSCPGYKFRKDCKHMKEIDDAA